MGLARSGRRSSAAFLADARRALHPFGHRSEGFTRLHRIHSVRTVWATSSSTPLTCRLWSSCWTTSMRSTTLPSSPTSATWSGTWRRGLRLVLSSREDPDLPLHKLRLSGELAEIREHDLRFETAEAAQIRRIRHRSRARGLRSRDARRTNRRAGPPAFNSPHFRCARSRIPRLS